VSARLAVLSFVLVLIAIALGGVLTDEPSRTLALKVTDHGSTPTLTAPVSMRGGLLTIRLTNQGKVAHSAQFMLIRGGLPTPNPPKPPTPPKHTPAEALKLLASHPRKIPVWLRAVGGVGPTAPGQTNQVTTYLTGGEYMVIDLGATASSTLGSGLTHTSMRVDPGNPGTLPKTPAAVIAAKVKHGYQWTLSGLRAGTDQVTFQSQGKKALHQLVALRLKGNPSLAQLKRAIQSNGTSQLADTSSPPSATAILDGNHSEVASLNLPAGNYAFYCPLGDRNGGKPHYLEGLLNRFTVR
jgi:hypothetical protein